MNEQNNYDQMWNSSFGLIAQGKNEYDPFLSAKHLDTRKGITLLTRLPLQVSEAVLQFLQEFEAIESGHYCQPLSDLHLTIMSIISCREDYQFDHNKLIDYRNIIASAIQQISPFSPHIKFNGLTVSPSCILLRGFSLDDTLRQFRDILRQKFILSNTEHSIDSRYSIQTAHSTIVRFTKPICNYTAVAKLLENYKTQDFGEFRIENTELLVNDWYQTQNRTQFLQAFSLI